MDKLEGRVEKLEDRVDRREEKYDDIFTFIKERLSIIETKINQPHPCKWDNVVPVLVEFKNSTDPIRNNIFRRLDHQDEEINLLKKDNELNKQNNTLLLELSKKLEEKEEEKEDEEKKTLKGKMDYNRTRRDRIIDAVSGGLAVVIVIEIAKTFIFK